MAQSIAHFCLVIHGLFQHGSLTSPSTTTLQLPQTFRELRILISNALLADLDNYRASIPAFSGAVEGDFYTVRFVSDLASQSDTTTFTFGPCPAV
jgi:hypothetical protein